MKILITGATGNVGTEIIRAFKSIQSKDKIIVGASNTERAQKKLKEYAIDEFRLIDFENSDTFSAALDGIDIVFLLRPPHLADIQKYFDPFFKAMKHQGITDIVFLSVQGVETQTKIPHYKVEQAIREYGFSYVFLRPSYFMQNLTTTLLHEIKTQNCIFIPAGNLKMNWVDVKDIGLVTAMVLTNFEKYSSTALEITGSEFIGFKKVADLLTQETGRTINYQSPNLLKFFLQKRKQGIKPAMIFVMIMLHYLPRFSKNNARLVDTVKRVTKKEPVMLADFIKREKQAFN